MKNKRLNYIKNILTPCLLLSVITGAVTGCVIFLFQFVADWVVSLSETIYSLVRSKPECLPLLLIGALLLGLLSVFAVKFLGIAKGGGIPTAIALVRGLIEFRWLRSIIATFSSALVTFLSGIPLGNEGPSVQIGTAIGRGTVRLFSPKNTAWDRYIMTGGAAAGFAATTSAPLTGIFFILEEAHRRFSPMLFMSAASAVLSSTAVLEILSKFHSVHSLLPFEITVKLELKYLWAVAVVGIICGITAIIFTKVHNIIGKFLQKRLSRISIYIKIPAIFVLTAIIGFFVPQILGTGRSLISELLYGKGIWYMLLLYFAVRAILLMLANNMGITGGLFVPSLTFGAIIGSLAARILTELGVLSEEYAPVIVIIGITSFLSAFSRIPITSVIFAIEAMNGLVNVLPIALGATLSYAVIEIAGISSFNDSVIEAKVDSENAGKKAHLVDTSFTITPNAFIIGKEIRDILWPPTCVITSVRKNSNSHTSLLEAGDILHLHYRTTDPEHTFKKLEDLIGKQPVNHKSYEKTVSESHQVPEN